MVWYGMYVMLCYVMYVCMYVCMYVWMYVSMYVCMYVCMYVWMYVSMYVCMYVWMDGWMHASNHASGLDFSLSRAALMAEALPAWSEAKKPWVCPPKRVCLNGKMMMHQQHIISNKPHLWIPLSSISLGFRIRHSPNGFTNSLLRRCGRRVWCLGMVNIPPIKKVMTNGD